MNYKSCLEFKKEDYDYIKNNCSDFDFWHSEEIIQGIKNTGRIVKPVLFYKDDEPIAFSFARFHKSAFGIIGKIYFGSRFLGTPLVIDKFKKDSGFYRFFLDEIVNVSKNIKAGEIELYPCENEVFLGVLSLNKKFKKNQLLDLYVNLEQAEEELWKKFSGNLRWSINFAKRQNLSCVVDNSDETFKFFYENFLNFSRHKKITVPSWLAPDVFSIFKNKYLDLFCCKKENKIFSTMILAKFNQKIISICSMTTDEGKKKKSSKILCWEVMCYYKQNGYTSFNLGGIAPRGIKPFDYGYFKLEYRPENRFYSYYTQTVVITTKLKFKALTFLNKCKQLVI